MKKKKLSDLVVVITGASSGIGRAAALQFAKKKTSLVLIARSAKSLSQAARECEELGAKTLTITADVTDEHAVQNAAKQAVKEFGRIDVWVNNAAVTLFGRFEESPYEEYRRVIETNLFGSIHGARAVLPIFREQGAGTLIQVSSMDGKVGAPYLSAYAASKFGVTGLTESLRMELKDAPEIKVCTVLAATIDTPLFQHASNYSGRAVKALPPVYKPEKAARAIVRLVKRPRAEVVVGNAGRMLIGMHYLMPRAAEQLQARHVENNHFKDRSAPPKKGNLFNPMESSNKVQGGWKTGGRQPSAVPMMIIPAAIALIGTAAWGAKKMRSRPGSVPFETETEFEAFQVKAA